MNLNKRIEQLENLVKQLESKIADLTKNTEEKNVSPYSVVGGIKSKGLNRPIDIKVGLGDSQGGSIIWNDTELGIPPVNEEPPLPNKGYNKHSHSRFSGGALIKDALEIVDYDLSEVTNKHSQQYWETEPSIKSDLNSLGEKIDRIGTLDLIFNPDTETWGIAAYEIDVKKCYLIERDSNGDISLDSKGQEKKSALFNSDTNKTSIVWDENAKVWRFYAVYAPGE